MLASCILGGFYLAFKPLSSKADQRNAVLSKWATEGLQVELLSDEGMKDWKAAGGIPQVQNTKNCQKAGKEDVPQAPAL